MESIKVMIVDDNHIDRAILGYQLKSIGIVDIVEKEDGLQALEYFSDIQINNTPENIPLIIFLDINMPNLDGFGFLKQFNQLRAHVNLAACSVIMLSSSESKEDTDKYNQFELISRYLVKGKIDCDELECLLKDIT